MEDEDKRWDSWSWPTQLHRSVENSQDSLLNLVSSLVQLVPYGLRGMQSIVLLPATISLEAANSTMFDPLRIKPFSSNQSSEVHLDVTKEQRWDRLYRPLLIGALPFLGLAIVRQTLTAVMMLQAYLLTAMLFGYLLLVEERDNLNRSWLWKAMAPIASLHLVVLALIFSWDKTYPDLASKGIISTSVLWTFGILEYYVTLWVVEFCRPLTNNEHRSDRQS
jgi:hypothetical protein